ncbi:MAG: M23 family metallopeptidase [Wolbachia sp.]
MKPIIFILLYILPVYTTETSTDFAVPFQRVGCHPSAQTLGSGKIDHKQAHYATFSMKPSKNWIPASRAGMTEEDFEATESNHDGRLLFISSNIKSSFFATGIEQGLAPNTVMKLIDIYENFGTDFKKDIVLESKLKVLFERSLSNQKTEEKILYTSLTTSKKAMNLYHYKLQSGKEGYFNKEGISLGGGKVFVSPLNGDFRISSKFGNRKHPIRGKIVFHKGVDYAAKFGAPIYAVAEGVIEYIGNNGGYGKYIKVRHKNGYSTCYAHVSKFSSDVKLSSKVKQGQVIAYVGSTGVATGPHLHYEVIYNGKYIDPLTIAHKNEVRLIDHELKEFKLFVNKIDKMINKEGSSEKEA